MRLHVMIAALLPALAGVLAATGCGSGSSEHTAPPTRAAATAATATPTPDATDLDRDSRARDIVYLYKVQGDDPYPWQVTVRADDTAAVVRGGGHGGGADHAMKLTGAQTARVKRLVAAVPWQRVAGHTVPAGGFGGNDNMVRYMLRRHRTSTTFAGGHMPATVSRLAHVLTRIIDGDIGTEVAVDNHHTAMGAILPGD